MQSPNILVIPAYVLIVDDDSTRLNVLRDRLRGAFREHDEVLALGSVEWLDNSRELIQHNPVQVVLVGRWTGWEHSEIRQALAETYPDVPFYFIDEDESSEQDGAPATGMFDTNPINSRISRIIRGLEPNRTDAGGVPGPALENGERPDWLFRGLSGTSSAIQSVRNDITLVAASDSTVLITGSAGTGKEIAARNIHFQSPRRLAPFVSCRCGTVAPGQLESELFGRAVDESDGAWGDGRGRFELADGGTLFLDDIGAMPFPLQFKLLRVLRERVFERVGGDTPRHVNIRIIAATHHDLDALVAANRFREDLHDSLNGFPIHVPDLKDRIEDLPVLLAEIQRKLRMNGGDGLTFSRAALDNLQGYGWPGNLRELSELVEALAARCRGREVQADDLPMEIRAGVGSSRPGGAAAASRPSTSHSHPDGLDLERYLADMERSLIRQALNESGGELAQAAERLNLGRAALVEKMRKYGI